MSFAAKSRVDFYVFSLLEKTMYTSFYGRHHVLHLHGKTQMMIHLSRQFYNLHTFKLIWERKTKPSIEIFFCYVVKEDSSEQQDGFSNSIRMWIF